MTWSCALFLCSHLLNGLAGYMSHTAGALLQKGAFPQEGAHALPQGELLLSHSRELSHGRCVWGALALPQQGALVLPQEGALPQLVGGVSTAQQGLSLSHSRGALALPQQESSCSPIAGGSPTTGCSLTALPACTSLHNK